ncbi:hypothetical protein Aperf_G00000085227 [Anoplocephala perfoliata]
MISLVKFFPVVDKNPTRHYDIDIPSRIVPTIASTMHADVPPHSEISQQYSALMVDSLTYMGNFSSDRLTITYATAPLVFYYNLPEVPKNMEIVLSLNDIKDIFIGELKYWSDNRIRHKNPELPQIQQPISLIIRDDNCRANLALSAFLSNYSDNWKETYGTVTSLRNFKAPCNTTLYRTVTPSGVFSLLNSIPYSMTYHLATVPPFPKISIHMYDGKVANPAEFNCKRGTSRPYPLVSNFHVIIKKDLAMVPYNISLRPKDSLQRLSPACILQVEIYRYLNWLTDSIYAELILASFGLCQANRSSHNMREMTCLNRQNSSVQTMTLYSEEVYSDDADGTIMKYIIISVCATAIILLVVSLVLFRYFWSGRHPLPVYCIEQLEFPKDSTANQAYSNSYRAKNTAFLKFVLGGIQARGSENSYAISKNFRKNAVDTWIYADTILSTAPVQRIFKNKDVLLRPLNFQSSHKFSERERDKLQKYTEVDHENVVHFYGLAKSSAQKFQMARKARHKESMIPQGYLKSDFILPWIYYSILEPCIHGSLFELLHSGQYEISHSMRLTIASDIASGMAYLHDQKIIHGSLSSLTCLLNSRWVVKITRWQKAREILRSVDVGHKSNAKGAGQRHIQVTVNPEYLRLLWKSPAQLRGFIAAQESTKRFKDHRADRVRTMEHTFTKRVLAGSRKDQILDNRETVVEKTLELENNSMAGDVYSFGVILTEIGNLEVPFQSALTMYQSERQLAEAICSKVHLLSIPITMHPKVREITEFCIDHSEEERPSFRDILKTLAGLLPKGRSVAHYMLRAAAARINDLKSTRVNREHEINLLKSQLYSRLDRLFSPIYSRQIIHGSVPLSITTPSAQNALLAVVTLDSTFLQSAADGDENAVLCEMQRLKQISEKHADNETIRCLAAPGGFENDGVCFVAMNYGGNFEVNSKEDRELILRLLRVLYQVEGEFGAANEFSHVSLSNFCAVVHRSTAMWGPLGVYFPWQSVYGKALEDVFELKRFAKPMEVLVTAEVTRDIEGILCDFEDYILADTYHVQLALKKWKSMLSDEKKATGLHWLCSSKLTIAPYLLDRTKPAEEILANLTPEDADRLEYIKAEHSKLVSRGKKAPLNLKPSEYLDLLCCPSLSARDRYYSFRYKVSMMKESKKLKQAAKAAHEAASEPTQKNQILRMIRDGPIKEHRDDWVVAELRTAEDSAQTIVFDCSHEEEMRISDQKNLARQLAMAFAHNRTLRPFPFHFMFTSMVPGTNQYKFFEDAFGVNYTGSKYASLEECPFTVKSGHFSEVIKDRRLIYLSPNAPRAFENGEFDHDAVYVVGGIVDKAIRRPVTHAKARRAGWECMRLPLERYVNWRSGSKTLTLVAIHAILATAKATNGDWKAALEQNIPSRCLRDHDSVQREINRLFRNI